MTLDEFNEVWSIEALAKDLHGRLMKQVPDALTDEGMLMNVGESLHMLRSWSDERMGQLFSQSAGDGMLLLGMNNISTLVQGAISIIGVNSERMP